MVVQNNPTYREKYMQRVNADDVAGLLGEMQGTCACNILQPSASSHNHFIMNIAISTSYLSLS